MRIVQKKHDTFFCCALLALAFRTSLADERKKFPDEVEQPLAEYESNVVELKSSELMEAMKKTIAEIVDATKIGDVSRKLLEAEAKSLVERSLNPWKESLDMRLRSFLRQNEKESLALMAEWPERNQIRNGFVPEPVKLTGQEDWKNALKKVLAPEQLAALEKKTLEHEQEVESEIQEYLKLQLDVIRDEHVTALKAEATSVKGILGLTGERAKKADDLAEGFAKRVIDDFEKRMTEDLRRMSDVTRTLAIGGGVVWWGQSSSGFNDAGVPSADREGLRKVFGEILTEDERKRWETAVHARVARQEKAMAMMLVSGVDDTVLLTASQREKLEPLAAKLTVNVSQTDWENSSGYLNNLSKFKMEDLKLFLDEKQIEHWQRALQNQEATGDRNEKEEAAGDANLDTETILATYFRTSEKGQRNREAQRMRVKLEDVRRVANPSEESIKRLEIAAKGAAEHALDEWRPNFETAMRSNIGNTSAQMLKQRLAALGQQESFGEMGLAKEQPIWNNAVADVLTESQKKSWMVEVDGRKSYFSRARVLMTLSLMESLYALSQEQVQKLEPLLAETFEKYAVLFDREFQDDPRSTEHLMGLVGGLPQDKLKSILSRQDYQNWLHTYNESYSDFWKSSKKTQNGKNRKVN